MNRIHGPTALFPNADLAKYLGHALPQFRLFRHGRNLFNWKPFLFHDLFPFTGEEIMPITLELLPKGGRLA